MVLRSLKEMRVRDWVALAIIALVVGACGAFGSSYVLGEGYPYFDAVQTALLCVSATIVCMVVLFFADVAFARFVLPRTRRINRKAAAEDTEGEKAEKKRRRSHILAKITPSLRVSSIFLFALIMMLFWLPWFIANIPGSTYWDTYYQAYMIYPENHPIAIIPFGGHAADTLTDAWLTDHHPVLTTLIYGAFCWVSDQLTGDWMAGVFVFVCIQTILYLIVFTMCVAYMRARNCPLWLCFATYVFFTLMPFVATWAMCMVKDSMFSLFFILYFMMLCEAIRTNGRSFCRPRTIVFFALCALMLCLTKKTGLFIVIPVTIVGLWLFRPRKMRNVWTGGDFNLWAEDLQESGFNVSEVARASVGIEGVSEGGAEIATEAPVVLESPETATASDLIDDVRSQAKRPALCFLIQGVACIVIAAVLLPYVVFPLANIAPGGKQEALGPMLQQTARYVIDNGSEAVTTDEYYAIKGVIDFNLLANMYQYETQDKVKYNYKLDSTNEDLVKYLFAYMSMGVRHPESYFASIMSIAGSYLAPVDYINMRMLTVNVKLKNDDSIFGERTVLWNPLNLESMRLGMDEAYQAIADIPVLNIPLLMVTYTLWIPAILFYIMLRRRIKCGIAFIPLVVLIAFCVIAPIADARYAVPIIDVLPLFTCYMAILMRQKFAAQRSLAHAAKNDIQYQNPRPVYVKLASTSTI